MNKVLSTLIIAAFAATPAWAERPMAVDDAGTMDKGGAKVEFGWSRDDNTRGWDAAAGFAPIENLEFEVGFARMHENIGGAPDARIRDLGFAAKWVPLKAEQGLSAGLKFETGRSRSKVSGEPAATERAHSLTGLATWSFATGQLLHVNIGHEWVRADGPDDSNNTWGMGLDQPLTETLRLTLETFGNTSRDQGCPDKQIGLRWTVADGLKISGAVGNGNGRSFGGAGIAWEF